jgi:hypothetical protein
MDARQAAQNLELIRTLMERTVQYQLLTARAGLAAGTLAVLGAILILFLDQNNPWVFGLVWGSVFAGSVLATCVGSVLRSRARGEPVWSRQGRAVLLALAPSLFAALVLTVFFFSGFGRQAGVSHLWLPGIWMLCYGQGALATASFAPAPIRPLGISALLAGGVTLWLGPEWASAAMGVVFGLGHIGLGAALLMAEHREASIRLHRSVA